MASHGTAAGGAAPADRRPFSCQTCGRRFTHEEWLKASRREERAVLGITACAIMNNMFLLTVPVNNMVIVPQLGLSLVSGRGIAAAEHIID